MKATRYTIQRQPGSRSREATTTTGDNQRKVFRLCTMTDVHDAERMNTNYGHNNVALKSYRIITNVIHPHIASSHAAQELFRCRDEMGKIAQ